MDPFTLAMILMGANALFGGISSFMGQSSQNMALEYNAMMAEHNARISNIQAAEAEKRGRTEELRHRLRVKGLQGAQKAAAAGSNVMVDVGSPADILADTEILGEMDAMTIKYNTAMEAWGYRAQGTQYGIQAQMARQQKMSPYLALGSSILGSAGNLTSMYMMGKGFKTKTPETSMMV